MNIYLASASPRRKKMLDWMGLKYEVIDHGVDEEALKVKGAKELAGKLSLLKAYGGAEKVERGLVIGSDLVIGLRDKIFGKAKDIEDGRRILGELRGKEHSAWCGLAVVEAKSGRAMMSVDETKVKMKNYSDQVIDKYVKQTPVTDRAGAYGVQDKIEGYGSLVDTFEGSITTIIGMSMEYLENLLKEFAVEPKLNWRQKCRKETGYES